MRVGILGGTFDPVHTGHLAIARQAMEQVGLDRVLFIPAGNPRLKDQAPQATAEQRLKMVRLAVAEESAFEACGIEAHRQGPTYSVDTVAGLAEKLGPETELYFILGMDVLDRLDEWKDPQRLLELCRLIAVSRPGHTGFDWPAFFAKHPEAQDRVEVVATARMDISGTELRSRAATGSSLRGLAPQAVEDYIHSHGLYRPEPAV